MTQNDELTPEELAGNACVVCGLDAAHAGRMERARMVDGHQLYRCAGCTTELYERWLTLRKKALSIRADLDAADEEIDKIAAMERRDGSGTRATAAKRGHLRRKVCMLRAQNRDQLEDLDAMLGAAS